MYFLNIAVHIHLRLSVFDVLIVKVFKCLPPRTKYFGRGDEVIMTFFSKFLQINLRVENKGY